MLGFSFVLSCSFYFVLLCDDDIQDPDDNVEVDICFLIDLVFPDIRDYSYDNFFVLSDVVLCIFFENILDRIFCIDSTVV